MIIRRNQAKEQLKLRRRKQKEFFEEVYTDKDRAAAVSFGFFDIKQSLSQKAREDRNLALSLPEEAEPGSLLAMGMREAKNGNFESAVQFISKARMKGSIGSNCHSTSSFHILLFLTIINTPFFSLAGPRAEHE